MSFSQNIDHSIFLLRQQISPLLKENDEYIFQIEALSQEFLRLRQKSVTLEREIQMIKDLMAEYHIASQDEQQHASMMRKNLETVKQDLHALQKEYHVLEKEYQDLEAFIAGVSDKKQRVHQQAEKKARILHQRRQGYKPQRDKGEEEILNFEKKIRETQLVQENIQKDIEKKREEIISWKESLADKEEEKKKIMRELSEEKKIYKKYEQDLQRAEREKVADQSAMNQSHSALLKEKAELNQQTDIVREQIQKLNKEIFEIEESKKQALRSEENKIQKQIDDIQYENLLLTHQALMVQKEIEKIKKEKETLTNLLQKQPDEEPLPRKNFEQGIHISPEASAVFVKPQDFLKIPDILKDP